LQDCPCPNCKQTTNYVKNHCILFVSCDPGEKRPDFNPGGSPAFRLAGFQATLECCLCGCNFNCAGTQEIFHRHQESQDGLLYPVLNNNRRPAVVLATWESMELAVAAQLGIAECAHNESFILEIEG
jgi:hypothetical protein